MTQKTLECLDDSLGTLSPAMPPAALEDIQTTRASFRHSVVPRKAYARVMTGPNKGQTMVFEPGTSLTVGVSDDNGLPLKDPMVSRYHLELKVGHDGIEIEDLGSLNGTWMGGTRIHKVTVALGTQIKVGASTLLLGDAGETQAPSDHHAPRIDGLIGESPAMQRVVETIHRLAPSPVSVLLQGETGTGKEVLARSLHDLSDRAGKPFVTVDCGSLPPTLVASELFGHDRGAFTGAERRREGAFERAHGGTLFLDEIGELPLDVQPVLLGALERRRFRRLGSSQEVSVDVRVIAATHRDLRSSANDGSFRADLYFRLAVARVVIPALRDRLEDLEPLVRHFVEQLTGEPDLPFDAATLHSLQGHRFSGNVRELRNMVEGALAMGEMVLDPGRQALGSAPATAPSTPSIVEGKPYREARADVLREFERRYLGSLIERCNGNASAAAREAKMDRPYLLTLLRKHGLR